jgi:hypothetical protein
MTDPGHDLSPGEAAVPLQGPFPRAPLSDSLYAKTAFTTFAASTPVSLKSKPWNL